jgi:hypothetical protein
MSNLIKFNVRLYPDADAEETICFPVYAKDEEQAQRFALDAYPEADSFWITTAPKDWYVVSIYKCDRAYGGPEEGGWYYGYGEPVIEATPLMRTFRNRNKAVAYMNQLQRHVDRVWNKGRYPISSVLSDGEYRAIIDENEQPSHYPKERPHYE